MSEARESLHEALSAAVDGEADELELRRVLNAARDNPELHGRWERMHLVGEALRGASLAVHHRQTDAWRRQAEGAAEELSPLTAQGGTARRRWISRIAGGSVAAAVAVAVVLYFGNEETTPAPEPNAVAAAETAPGNLAQLPSEQDLRRANAYLLHHAQHTSAAARPAAMPFVKALAAHDNNARLFTPTPANRQLREASSR